MIFAYGATLEAVTGVAIGQLPLTTRFEINSGEPWTLVKRDGRGSGTVAQTLIKEFGEPNRVIVVPAGLLTWAGLVEAWHPGSGPVVGCGGGTVLDAAKIIAAIDAVGGVPTSPNDLLKVRSRAAGSSLICVPTTAGSGSELTLTASLWDYSRKFSLEGDVLRPDCAVYATRMICDAPQDVLISAAWDAASHALESLWSRKRDARSMELALRALRLLSENLFALGQGHQPDWGNLQEGAAAAGAAISITRTGLAHALSYPLTIATSCPHGLAAGLCSAAVSEFMLQGDKELETIVSESLSLAPRRPHDFFRELWRVTGAVHAREFINAATLFSILVAAQLEPSRALASRRSASREDLNQIIAVAAGLLSDVPA